MARKPTVKRGPKLQKPTLLQRLRTDFLTGLVVVLPMFLTIYLVWWVVSVVDARVIPLIPARYNPENVFGRNIFGLGVIVFLVFTTGIGALTKGFFGRSLLRFSESLVERTPIVRSVYNALKQIVETALSPTSSSFKQACLLQYPRKGIWALAFISTEARGEVARRFPGEEMLSVFLPTTPNPTSGFLLYVPKSDVIVLDMSVEEAAKLIISAGLVAPPTKAALAEGRRPSPSSATAPVARAQESLAHQTSGSQPIQSPYTGSRSG